MGNYTNLDLALQSYTSSQEDHQQPEERTTPSIDSRVTTIIATMFRENSQLTLPMIVDHYENPSQKLALLRSIIKARSTSEDNIIKLVTDVFSATAATNTYLDQKVAVAMEIARRGKSLASFLAKQFDTLALSAASQEQRFELAKMIAENTTGLALCNNINKFALTTDQRLVIATLIAQKGEPWAGNLAAAIDYFALDQATPDQRLELAILVTQQGGESAEGVLLYFEDFFLSETTPEQRLNLANVIAKYVRDPLDSFSSHIHKFGFTPDVQNKFMTELIGARYVPHSSEMEKEAVMPVSDEAPQLNQSQEKPSRSSVQDGLKGVQQESVDLGGSLNLETATLNQRLNQVKLIAKQNEKAAVAVAKNFAHYQLDEATPEQRLECAELIASQGPEAAVNVVENLNAFKLDELPAEKRLALANQIACGGKEQADAMAKNVALFKLDKTLSEERLQLAMRIVSAHGANALAANVEKFTLGQTNRQQRLDLLKMVVRNGASSVLRHLPQFELGALTLKERLEIAWIIYESETTFNHNTNYSASAANNIAEFLSLSLEPKFVRQLIRNDLELYPAAALYCHPQGKRFDQTEVDQFLQFLRSNPNGKDLSSFAELFQTTIDVATQNAKTKTDRENIALQLWRTCAYLAIEMFNNYNNDKIEALTINSEWIAAILEYRNPALRFSFIDMLGLLPAETLRKGLPGTETTDSPKGKAQINPRAQSVNYRCWILLSRLTSHGLLTPHQANQIFQVIAANPKALRETQHQLPFYEYLYRLDLHGSSSMHFDDMKAQCTPLLEMIEKEIPKKKKLSDTLEDLAWLNRLYNVFGGTTAVLEALSNKEKRYEDIFKERFGSLFIGADTIADLGKRYHETFGQFRNPTALFTYLGKMNLLQGNEKTSVHQALSDFVIAVLNGTFRELRYSTNGHPHLEKLFSLKGVKDQWLTADTERPLMDEIKTEAVSTSVKISERAYFREKIIVDHHLQPLNEYPYIRDYLNAEEGASERDFVAELDKLMRIQPKKSATLLKLQIQRELILLCKGEISLKEFVASRPAIDLGELENDLKALMQRTERPKYNIAACTISESDDPCDLFLIGTEVDGSCQRVDGDPDKTKCLMGYALNGEIRAIVVNDAEGKIVARSVLRLMWDGAKPVILQERIYSNMSDEVVYKAINQWAIGKAKAMGVSLVAAALEDGSRKPYTGKVEFLGGRAPFIYSDASGGVMEGSFTTPNCELLYESIAA